MNKKNMTNVAIYKIKQIKYICCQYYFKNKEIFVNAYSNKLLYSDSNYIDYYTPTYYKYKIEIMYSKENNE